MKNVTSYTRLVAVATFALGFAACAREESPNQGNENEVITTVTLTFVPTVGGAAVVARVNDADGDGGNAPTIDPINLASGMYDLTLTLENRLETPSEDITAEVRDEAVEHQIFFTGTGVNGPASDQVGAPVVHSYADLDANGLPIGLANKITASAGGGILTVTLRHMPPVNDAPVKTASAVEVVRTGGFATLGGSTDVQVNFPLTVL